MHLRTAGGVLGLVEVSRMGTGLTNDLQLEIFGDKGALRFSAADPGWLEVYDVRDAEKPIGGMRGFRKVEAVQRYEGQKAPDWSMAPDFVRTHAECQYQFLKAVAEDHPASSESGRRSAHSGGDGGRRVFVVDRQAGSAWPKCSERSYWRADARWRHSTNRLFATGGEQAERCRCNPVRTSLSLSIPGRMKR